MRLLFLLRSAVVLFLCWGSALGAQASHSLGIDLTYEYAGTPASPNQYHVIIRQFRDPNSPVANQNVTLTCGKYECGTALPGSFTVFIARTSDVPVPPGCTSSTLFGRYAISTFETLVQLPPASWTLSASLENRSFGVVNVANSETLTSFVKAELDNTTGLVNSSPRFTTNRLIQLTSTQGQQYYSLSAFDPEGDSLVYQLVQPLANPTAAAPCGLPTVGAIAPHFQLNPVTGELLTWAGPAQIGRYALAARVDEYRQVGGTWRKIGSIMRDMTYTVGVGANQMPAFTRVAPTGRPTEQLLGQILRVNPGQTLSLTLTATDPDAGQLLALSSEVAATVPGATFQDLGNGQSRLTWPVPATQPLGRYALTATAMDNFCPTPGATVVTLPILVTRQVLATQKGRLALVRLPYPTPFTEEVQFQLGGTGKQAVRITDELGRNVVQLLSAPDGTVVWRPAAGVQAGFYLARTLSGSQVARLSYSGQ